VKNPGAPQILGKQYKEDATPDMARTIAHRFADEIIARLGSGIAGIAESQIYFVSNRSGNKEIWQMDYDGANQKQITKLGSIALSPRISPDGSRLAFSGLARDSWQIMMYSLELGRTVSFPRSGGDNFSPAWASDGTKIAFSSTMHSGLSEIFVADANGGGARRLSTGKGDAEAGKRIYADNCVSCHGSNFSAPIDPSYPKLAGQHADYLFVALKAYQTDHNPLMGRNNAIMMGMARPFTHPEIKAIAAYLGSLPGDLKTVQQPRFR